MALRLKDILHRDLEHYKVHVEGKVVQSLSSQGLTDSGCLFVVTNNGTLKGIVTDGDIRRSLDKCLDINEVLIGEVMTKKVIKAYENKSLVDSYKLMIEKSINQLPVVNSKEVLIGFLAFHELARHLSPEHLFIDLKEQSNRTENERRHISRYKFAANFIRPNDKVLDSACGSGYGSKILWENASEVMGIDANYEIVEFANQHYGKKSLKFVVSEIGKLAFQKSYFDAIVSIETLEHLPNTICRKYLCKMASWIKPKGILVVSSPMLRYKGGKPFVTSPYHINELPKSELMIMFETCLPNFILHFYYQDETRFVPLLDEHTGFCILVARKVT